MCVIVEVLPFVKEEPITGLLFPKEALRSLCISFYSISSPAANKMHVLCETLNFKMQSHRNRFCFKNFTDLGIFQWQFKL